MVLSCSIPKLEKLLECLGISQFDRHFMSEEPAQALSCRSFTPSTDLFLCPSHESNPLWICPNIQKSSESQKRTSSTEDISPNQHLDAHGCSWIFRENSFRFQLQLAASRVPGQGLHQVIDRALSRHFQLEGRGRGAGHRLAHLELHADGISWNAWIPREPHFIGILVLHLLVSFPSPVKGSNRKNGTDGWLLGFNDVPKCFWGYAVCSSWKCWALSVKSCPLKPWAWSPWKFTILQKSCRLWSRCQARFLLFKPHCTCPWGEAHSPSTQQKLRFDTTGAAMCLLQEAMPHCNKHDVTNGGTLDSVRLVLSTRPNNVSYKAAIDQLRKHGEHCSKPPAV